MRFYRDHQVAHELSNQAASSLQAAFLEDHAGNVEAALGHYERALKSLRSTAGQWSLVLASSTALQTFLPGKLREEFVESMASLDMDAFVRDLEVSGNCPRGFSSPYQEVARLLSEEPSAERAVIGLFSASDAKIESLLDFSKKIIAALKRLETAVRSGLLWDTVVPQALLQSGAKHELIDLDEKYFSVLMDHAFFLEAISQMSRDVLIKSDIPYEDCKPRRP